MGNVANTSGLSLVEVITAVAVLGIAIPPIAAMFRGVAQNSPEDLYQNAALHAANSLMEEIVSKSFEDPDLPSGSFGTEELRRVNYDDIDDFDGYDSTTTQAPDTSPDTSPGIDVVPTSVGSGSIAPADVDSASDVLADAFPSPFSGIALSAFVDNVLGSDTDPDTAQADGSTDYKRITVSASWTVGRGGEVRFRTLRTNLPDAVGNMGPLDGPGSAGSATQSDSDSFDIVLINPGDESLLISAVKVEADRATPLLNRLGFALEHGPIRSVWLGAAALPTEDLSPNTPGSRIPELPPQSFIVSRVDFLQSPLPGSITFTVTYTFTNGSRSVLTMPMVWE